VVAWSSAGAIGFKGSRKSTPFAATRAAETAAQAASKIGMREIEVRVRGAGSGRESAVTALQRAGLRVTAVEDRTAIPLNGCRPRKKRRVYLPPPVGRMKTK
jgi:small subunit ribosomal protein S11